MGKAPSPPQDNDTTSPAEPNTSPRFDLVDNRISKALDDRGLAGGGGGGHNNGMDGAWRTSVDNRIGGLEKSVEGMRSSIDGFHHSQNMTLTAVVGVGAMLAAFLVYMVQRIDTVDGKVNALPSQIGDSVRESNRAFAEALSAAVQATKQQTPQVIIVPQSQPQQTPPQPGKH